MIDSFRDYPDLLEKLKKDFEFLKKEQSTYKLVDCLFTINALPEWILNSSTSSTNLKNLAQEKLDIMRDENIDPTLLQNDLNHQLRFVRYFSNHLKHNSKQGRIPAVIEAPDPIFPLTFPIQFGPQVAIGINRINSQLVIQSILDFWDDKINKE